MATNFADELRELHELTREMFDGSEESYAVTFKNNARKYSLAELIEMWRIIPRDERSNDFLMEMVEEAVQSKADEQLRTEMYENMMSAPQASRFLWNIVSTHDPKIGNKVWASPHEHSVRAVCAVATHDAALSGLVSLLRKQHGEQWFEDNVMKSSAVTPKTKPEGENAFSYDFDYQKYRHALHFGVQKLQS